MTPRVSECTGQRQLPPNIEKAMPRPGIEPGPSDLQSDALPTELSRLLVIIDPCTMESTPSLPRPASRCSVGLERQYRDWARDQEQDQEVGAVSQPPRSSLHSMVGPSEGYAGQV